MSQDVVSFVLRFVREAGEEEQARWRGTVKHVQGSTERRFSRFSEALHFMQNHMSDAVEDAFQDGVELNKVNPLLETARLWGEFLPEYNKILLERVSNASQAKAALNPVEGFANMWTPWLKGEDGDVEGKLDALSEQLAAMQDTLSQLQKDVKTLKANADTSRSAKKAK